MKEFTQDQRKALHKIELLLRKAEGNANENEAAVATQLAQDLLAKYNLSMEALGSEDQKKGTRADVNVAGGFFDFERDLWRGIAELNWCWYFSDFASGIHKGHATTRVHRVIGREVNISSTRLMAEYLMETVTRLAKEYSIERTGKYHNRSQLVTSFRKGAMERLVGKLNERRWTILAEERKKAETGEGNGTALVMTRLSQSEYERNFDFLYGEGAYAAAQARNAKWKEEEEARKVREEEWKKANPEEAARMEREAEKAAQKEEERWRKKDERARWSRKDPAGDMGAYHAGKDAAADISLDPQVGKESAKPKGRLVK